MFMKPENYTYYALFNNNGHANGFRPLFMAGDKINTSLSETNNNKLQFIFINYDYKNKIEHLSTKHPSALEFPESVLFEAKEIFKLEQIEFPEPSKKSKNITITPLVSKEEYIRQVSALKKHIQQGNIYEINYCITFEARHVQIDPLAVYAKLNSISNAPYSAIVKLDDKYIICSSPELFLHKQNQTLLTKPIKGTAARNNNPDKDLHLKTELQNSLKERTENVMIVDVARNDLSRLAQKGSVTVNQLYNIESYEQVHQMVSTVSCELKDNPSFKDIIHATFPMASMTGAPKIKAMELIDEFEHYNRGPFSGSIGYIDEKGDFMLNVLIRSIFYNQSQHYLSFSVGSAITHLCDPEKEYEECMLKANALMRSLS